MKKRFALICVALLALCAVALTACNETETPIDPTMVTITFDINYDSGVNPQEQTVEQGATVLLPVVSRDNYDFDGWYTASTGGTPVGAAGDSYVANTDVTLYAHWSEHSQSEPDPTTVTVQFAINYEGGVNPTAQTVNKGTTIKLPEVSRDNYDFDGWYTASSNGDFVGDAGDDYVANATVTLYAHWQEQQSSEPVESKTIVFYSTQNNAQQEITEVAIEHFEAKYPGWKVQHIIINGNDNIYAEINKNLQTNQQPDVAYSYADHVATYLQTGKVVDMNKFINSQDDVNDNLVGYTADEIADFYSGLWNAGIARNTYGNYIRYGYDDNSMLTLPFVTSTEVMYYNKTLLDELELTPATTWDELWQQSQLIQRQYPYCTPVGYDSEANWFITMCQQNGWGYTSAQGDNHYLFNNDDTVNWLNQLNGYWKQGYFVTQKIYGAYMSNLFLRGVENGGSVYCIGSTSGASIYKTNDFEVGVARIPGSNGNNQSIALGPSLVMFGNEGYSNADERELMTFLFIKELLNPEFQAIFAMASGVAPVRSSVYEIPSFQEFIEDTNVVSQTIKLLQSVSDDLFISPAFVGSANVRTQVDRAFLAAVQGSRSASEALDDAYKNCDGK